MGDNLNTQQTMRTKSTFRKAGRTLLVNSPSLNDYNGSDLTGLQSSSLRNNTLFLTFDTIPNSLSAYKKLRHEHSDWRVKFSYYRVFFTMVGLSDMNNYNSAKQSLMNYVNTNSDSNVLYCKFYKKNNAFLGCGDLTVDTLEGMNRLLQKDGGCKEFTFDGYTGTFYRFRTSQRDNTNDVNSSE